MPDLLSWVTSIRPRHQADALPMFVLLQNVTRGLIEERIRASRSVSDKTELAQLRDSEQQLR